MLVVDCQVGRLAAGLDVVVVSVVSVVIVVVDDEFLLIDNLTLSNERLKLITHFACLYISF